VQKQFFYSRPRASDQHGIDYDVEGRVNVNSLLDLEAGPDAHYMLCGPAAFVSSLETGLQTAGVPGSQIHFETF
jgi:ferredoxin-NADP reductase